jgi:hypothetical protein
MPGLVGGRPGLRRLLVSYFLAASLRCLWGSGTRPSVLIWLLCGSLVFVDEAAEDGPTLDPLPGKVGDRVVGPGWLELEAAMGRRPL